MKPLLRNDVKSRREIAAFLFEALKKQEDACTGDIYSCYHTTTGDDKPAVWLDGIFDLEKVAAYLLKQLDKLSE